MSEARIPQKPPIIAPLSSEAHRVMWSVMIPAYNCGEYLADAITSVLQQDMGEQFMQIEVVDDFSTDIDVKGLVQTIGKGRVSYYRQDKNVGSLRNFESCLNRANGIYVHLLHGDDRVLPGFYMSIQKQFEATPDAGATFCLWNTIDETGKVIGSIDDVNEANGIIKQSLLKFAKSNIIQYASIVVKREVYEKLGGFYAVKYGEDWLMWLTIAKHYPVAFIPKLLSQYGVHANSISSSSLINGDHFGDIKRVLYLSKSILPTDKAKDILLFTKQNYSFYILNVINISLQNSFNPFRVIRQLWGVLNFYVDRNILKEILAIMLRLFKQIIRIKARSKFNN